jgi:hypothetical protein
MARRGGGLTDILDGLEEAGGREAVSLGSVLDAFEHRSFGALLTVFGAMAALTLTVYVIAIAL